MKTYISKNALKLEEKASRLHEWNISERYYNKIQVLEFYWTINDI